MAKELYLSLTRGINTLSSRSIAVLQVLLGSVFLAMMAQIAIPIPFTPVPMSLQSLGVALLAITLGPRKAPLAVLSYLAQASIGLPVLAASAVNPLWIMAPRAGYLLGFAVASFIVGTLLRRHQGSFYRNWLILSLNETIILFCGACGLSLFLGWEKGITMGVLPFLPCALVKITIAASSMKPIQWIKSKM